MSQIGRSGGLTDEKGRKHNSLLLLLVFDYFANNDIGYKCRILFF